MEQETLISVKSFATIHNVSAVYIYRLINNGRLRATLIDDKIFVHRDTPFVRGKRGAPKRNVAA